MLSCVMISPVVVVSLIWSLLSLLALVNRSHPAGKGDSGEGNSGENGDSTYVMTEDHAAAFKMVLLVA